MDKILSLIKQGKMNPALALIKENLSKCHIKDSKYIKSVFIKNYCKGKNYYKGEYLQIDFYDKLNLIHGPNGSGKSKFLILLNAILSADFDLIVNEFKFDNITIIFDNEYKIYITYREIFYLTKLKKVEFWGTKLDKIFDKINNILSKTSNFNKIYHYLLLLNIKYRDIVIDEHLYIYNWDKVFGFCKSYFLSFGDEKLVSDIFSSIDFPLKIKTHTDYNLFLLDKDYIDSTLDNLSFLNSNIKKEDKVIICNDLSNRSKTFIIEFNRYFKDTCIKINKENHHLLFDRNGETIFMNDLSLGQRNLIRILFTAYMQNHKHCIFIIDTPETALHVSWQRMLVDSLEKINPNAQLIIATHSPQIVNGCNNNLIAMGYQDEY